MITLKNSLVKYEKYFLGLFFFIFIHQREMKYALSNPFIFSCAKQKHLSEFTSKAIYSNI